MIGNPQEMRARTWELANSAWTLSAVASLFESGLDEHLREPHSVDDLAARCPVLTRGQIERCLGVAAAVGVVVADGATYRLAPGALPFTQPPMRGVVQADARAHLMQALAFLDGCRDKTPQTGWRHTNAALLQAQGDGSAAFAPMFKMMLVPSMGDLAARLERPEARFLDVGVGVASLAIAMCRCWPTLHAVGVDASDVPLAIAKDNVARANLADRIELRKVAVEELRDEESFDFAWVPSFFIGAAALPKAVARVRASLRPGGWIILPIGGLSSGEEQSRAVLALVTELWGGPVLVVPEAEALLKEAGFTSIRTLPGPAWAPPTLVAQR